jgi:Ran GTPase-activating protein 1
MHYVAKIEGKRMWEGAADIKQIIEEIRLNKDNIIGIELSSNSLGYEAAKALAEEIKELKNLEVVNYRDIFVSRKKEDLPKSLFELIKAVENKNIRVLDLSDNAFGPIGVQAFDFFLRKTTTLKELYIENNGLGPEGAEMVAQSLLDNPNISLESLKINRNRLENKGALAFSKVLNSMKSLKLVQFFQNGIKEEGMAELIKSFGSNQNLNHIKLNDNLIKNSAPALIEVLPKLTELISLDISDSLLGHEHSVNIFKTISGLEKIKEVYCNYNEIEKKSSQKNIFEICLGISNLEVLEIKGNDIDPSLWKKYKKDMQKKFKVVEPYSDEEEVIADEEEELVDEIENLSLNK